MTYHVYVSLMDDDRIARFTMDADSGALEPRDGIALAGGPAPMTFDPSRRFVHVAQRESCELSSFAVDAVSGDWSLLGSIPLESDPCYIDTDRGGRYLLSAYYNAATAAVHGIGEDGAAQHPPIEWRSTATGAHCFQTDPSNRFAFVPHIANRGGPNAIFQFRFDAATGRIADNEPARLTPAEPVGPRHFCFHPAKDIVYVSNEQGCSVSAYDFNSTAGTLAHRQTLSTLPEGWSGENSCSQIRITPSGRFLYAPNRGHNSIAGFAVDAASGQLSPLGHVEAEPVPRAFGLDPQARFLLSAGLETGRLAVYRIDEENGQLERIATHDVGARPMWVSVIPAE